MSNPASSVPPGLRAVPKPEPAPEPSPAEQAARQQQARHDELATLLEKDPATLLMVLPGLYQQDIANIVTNGVVQAIQMLGTLPVKPTPGHVCAVCMQARLEWNMRHAVEIEDAQRAIMGVTGATSPADPQVQQADLAPFLPADLRPGAGPDALPGMVTEPLTIVGGMEVCPGHHPAAPQTRGRLIAVQGMNVHTAVQLAMGATAGLPGTAAG